MGVVLRGGNWQTCTDGGWNRRRRAFDSCSPRHATSGICDRLVESACVINGCSKSDRRACTDAWILISYKANSKLA